MASVLRRASVMGSGIWVLTSAPSEARSPKLADPLSAMDCTLRLNRHHSSWYLLIEELFLPRICAPATESWTGWLWGHNLAIVFCPACTIWSDCMSDCSQALLAGVVFALLYMQPEYRLSDASRRPYESPMPLIAFVALMDRQNGRSFERPSSKYMHHILGKL